MILKYKTSINCSNCVRSVSSFLDEVEGIDNWHVDTDSQDKILTVEGFDVDSEKVEEAVQGAGFEIVQMGMWKN